MHLTCQVRCLHLTNKLQQENIFLISNNFPIGYLAFPIGINRRSKENQDLIGFEQKFHRF